MGSSETAEAGNDAISDQETEDGITRTISEEELTSLVDEIFGSMAGMQLARTEKPLQPDKRSGYIVSAVQIVGSWQGAVRLDTDLGLARQACARLLGVEPSDLSPDDIRDAAGELANMVGGSVKALLAPTCGLSLPSVVMGHNYEFCFLQGKVIRQASFTHDAGCLSVSIVKRDAL